MTGDTPPLALTMGDPSGIGPELALAAWRDGAPKAPFVVFATPSVPARRRQAHGFHSPDHRD